LVGGAGKTPTVISIVEHLRAQGLQVGVVSKGYGRSATGTVLVHAQSRPRDCGDEPLLIHLRTGVPVAVGRSRIASARVLLAHHPQTQVLLMDDGLQDYSLWRDAEVCVVDERGLGNGWLLPAVPLRELWPRPPLAQAGLCNTHLMVLNTGGPGGMGQFHCRRRLLEFLHNGYGQRSTLQALSAPGGKPIKAIAGIARPTAFFQMLEQAGGVLAAQEALPDHADFLGRTRASFGSYTLVCTEKDAAQLWAVAPDAWAVPLEQNLEPGLYTALDAHIAAAWAGRLSSLHGH
jgi:tetraacyldisaccharide 4'-kinase